MCEISIVRFKYLSLLRNKWVLSQKYNNCNFNRDFSNRVECLPSKGWRCHSTGSSLNIVSSPVGEVPIPNLPFHELMFQRWIPFQKKTAVICGLTGRKYTFKDLIRCSKFLGGSFQSKLKLKKGDFIAVVLPNCPEYPIIVLGCSLIGVVPTTVNPSYTVGEITKQLLKCNVKTIITDQIHFPKCLEVTQELKNNIPIVVVKTIKSEALPENSIDFFEFINPFTSGNLEPVSISPEDTLILPFSSGTTGVPKGVILTHRNLVANLAQISHPETLIMNPTTRFYQDTILGVLPLFHIYGLVIVTFYSLFSGCKVVLLPKFEPVLFVKNLVRKRVNILYLVPPLLKFLGHEKFLPKYLNKIRIIVNAAAPMALPLANKVLDKAPHILIAQGYGMTEASPGLAHTSRKRTHKMSAIGIPIASTKFKITCLETGEYLPMNKRGELCAWGPQVMKGYFEETEDTKAAFDKDGWLRTGDIAYYDEDGDFFIVDRLKSLIKVKGFQVAPAELEELIIGHPKIQEVAVIGVKHESFGEVPRAFVVLHQGAQMTEKEVEDLVKEKLSSYKHLAGGVRFVKELPKNSIGKIIRKELEKAD